MPGPWLSETFMNQGRQWSSVRKRQFRPEVPPHTSIVLTFSLRAWSHLGAKQPKLFLVPHIQQWHSSFHRREHLVEEADMIRNEGQGVRSLPFSLALPQALHSMVAYPRRITIPLQCGMGGMGVRTGVPPPTNSSPETVRASRSARILSSAIVASRCRQQRRLQKTSRVCQAHPVVR